MARLARAEVFSPDEVAVVHVMNRVVRRCFLLGEDPVTGKNYDHRKEWIERDLRHFAACFGIDLLGFAILSNHFHLILRSRPDVVATWDDTEVARRWLLLCPVRKDGEGNPEEPNEMELNSIRNDPAKLERVRLRLSDLAWWMRLLCQHIAVRANHEDGEVGKFWQSRFRAVRLLDEAAILACAAYVDLNPIRAGLAKSLETSEFTSVQRRIESQTATPSPDMTRTPSETTLSAKAGVAAKRPRVTDRFLSPLRLNERSDAPQGSLPNRTGFRCSNKGFLPLSLPDYLALLKWTAKRGSSRRPQPVPLASAEVLTRLGMDGRTWGELVDKFGQIFRTVAGRPQTVDATRSRVNQHRYQLSKAARELMTPVH